MGEPVAEVGYLAGLCGHDGTVWIKALIDADGHLQVDAVSSGLPTGAATEATLAELSARVGDETSPAAGSVNKQLETLLTAILYRATAPAIYNVTMTSADTEYSQAMPANCKKFCIKCRGEYDIKLAFTENESGTTYITIPSGQCYWDDLIRDASLTLYFQCATAGQVAEITAWN